MHKWLIKKEKTIDPATSTVPNHNNRTNYDMPVEHVVESNTTNNINACFEKVTQTKGKK